MMRSGSCIPDARFTRSRSTGKEHDSESGNDYFEARYYGASMGRFLSPDDGSDQDPEDPQSWNLYSYVRNNPLIDIDPDGHGCQTTTFTSSYNGEPATTTTIVDRSDCQKSLSEMAVNLYNQVKDAAGKGANLASQATQQFNNIMQTPGGASCMGKLAVGGMMVGGGSGAAAGLLGIVGGPIVLVSEPVAIVGGGGLGGLSGIALGMTICPGGAASGGGGTSVSRGSTGRGPKNLKEQLAVEQAEADPQAGTVVPVKGGMQDARWPGSQGWVKMRQYINGVEVHYVRNTITGAVDDFKIK